MHIIFILIPLLALNYSCSTTKNLMSDYSEAQCQEKQISATVYDLGKKGKTEDEILQYFNTCVKDFNAEYKRKDIIKQYKLGLKTYCHKSTWEEIGQNYGIKGSEYQAELAKIKVCQIQNIRSAFNGLKRGHKNGLKRYCNKDVWQEKGIELGKLAGDEKKYSKEIQVCTLNKVRSAQSGFQRGYKNGMKLYCQSLNWNDLATDLAKQGKDNKELIDKAQLCVQYKADRKAIKKVQKAYKKALPLYCNPDKAYDMGLKGFNYDPSFCSSEMVEALNKEYELGKVANKKYAPQKK